MQQSNYRYTLTDRLGNIVASPLGESDFSIEWTRDDDSGKRTYKKEFGGKIVFTGEAFTRLYRMERTIYRCEYQQVVIERRCVTGGVSYWGLWFDGLISLNEGVWDIDNCRVETKFEENKPEQCFEDNKSEKINLLQETYQRRTVKMFPDNVTFETHTSTLNEASGNQTHGGYYWDGDGTPDDGMWTAYSHSEYDDGIHHRTTTMWVRQTMTLDCMFILIGGDGGWVTVENTCSGDPGGQQTGYKKYARRAAVYDCQTTSDNNAEYTYDMTCKIVGKDTVNTTFDNGIPLEAVIQAFITKFCPGITIKSDFFQINPVNATNINYVTGKTSKVTALTIYQKSDVKRPGATGNASKLEWSWDKLMNALNFMFNVEWRIENETLIIEHASWFKRNKGLDLTQQRYDRQVKGHRKYSYTNDNIPKQEVWKYAEADYAGDFTGVPIIYTNGCVTKGGKDTIKTYVIEDVLTDVEYAIANGASDSSKVADEGIFIIAAQGGGENYSIISEPGILEETSINNSLGIAQLLRDYHRWERPLRSGRMNNFETEFLSTIPTKKGETLVIPFCCGDEFSPDDTITTPLGTGIVDKAKFNFKESTLELDLLYEANTNLESNAKPIANNDTAETDKDVVTYINILSNDDDEPGDKITGINIVNQPQHGAVEILSDKRIKYIPENGYVGDDYFTYNYTDKWLEPSNNALVAINVRGVYTVPPSEKKTVFVKMVQGATTTTGKMITCDGQNQNGGTVGTANFTLYFYLDQDGTIPLDVSGYGLEVHATIVDKETYSGETDTSETSVSVPGGTAYTFLYNYMVTELMRDCDYTRTNRIRTVTLIPGTGYTLVGQTPVEEEPPVDEEPTTPPGGVTIPEKPAAPMVGTTRNMPVNWGTAVKDDMFKNTTYANILKAEFDQLTGENSGKFGHLQPQDGTWDFSDMDRLMDWALANGKHVFWHNVVWPMKMPDWFDLKIANYTETQVINLISVHVNKVLDRYVTSGNYPGVLIGVDVINEPFEDNGTHKASKLYQRAPNYISKIIKLVNVKAPQLITFVNDYGQEYGGSGKTNALIALKSSVAAAGGRLDGIGCQMHVVARLSTSLFNDRIQAIAAAGLMVHVSEFDILMKNGTVPDAPQDQGAYPFMTPALQQEKARVISEIVNYYLSLPADKRFAFTTWSLSDADNGINLGSDGIVDYPGLRDLNYNPVAALLKLESKAMELKALPVYQNFRINPMATFGGSTAGTAPKAWTLAGSATGFGALQTTTAKGLSAKSTSSTAQTIAWVDLGVSDFTFIFGLSDLLGDRSENTNKNCFAVFRFIDASNHLFFGPSNSAPGAPWQLIRKTSNVNTTFITDTQPAGANDVGAIVCQGSNLKMYVNGRLAGEITLTDYSTRTKVGLKFKGNADTVSAVDFLAANF